MVNARMVPIITESSLLAVGRLSVIQAVAALSRASPEAESMTMRKPAIKDASMDW